MSDAERVPDEEDVADGFADASPSLERGEGAPIPGLAGLPLMAGAPADLAALRRPAHRRDRRGRAPPGPLDRDRRAGHLPAMLVYKILRADEWAELRAAGETRGAPVDLADGFVHLSTSAQLFETAARHFGGEEGLVLLALDEEALGPALRWEPSRGGALFPHLHGPLRMADLAWHAPLPLGPEGHVLPALPEAHVDPERGQWEAFKALPRDQPVAMLNLVRLRARAAYPPDRPEAEEGLTGPEAYARYGEGTAPVLHDVGGSIAWRGGFEATLIGPPGERWDVAFVARYPDAGAFMAMVMDARYRAAVVHRQAAVETSRLLRLAPAEAGGAFG